MVSKQKGFTIIELMISVMIMGVVMLLVTIGVIQVSRYYKQAQTKTTLLNATRELHAKFSQDLQYSGYEPIQAVVGTYNVTCVGITRYIVRNTGFVIPAQNTFAVDTLAGPGECASKPIDTSQSPMPQDTRVTQFTLTSPGGGLGPYTLTTRFVSASSADMFVSGNYNNNCVSASVGGQFCAVGSLSSTLVMKVSN